MKQGALTKWGILLSCLLFVALLFPLNSQAGQTTSPDPLRLEKYIKRFSWQDAKNSYPQRALLFIGSSSIYKWKTAAAFPDLNIINRGIPGAEISDLNHFYADLVEKYRPETVVFYCGDNDVASGKNPQQIEDDFRAFVSQQQTQNPSGVILYEFDSRPGYHKNNRDFI